MKYSKNILETIGNTPLIRLNSITKNIKPMVLAKVESFNPGNSVKDRMALKMIEDAEDEGKLNTHRKTAGGEEELKTRRCMVGILSVLSSKSTP